MKNYLLARSVAFAVAASIITACGGGGSSALPAGPAGSNPPSVPLGLSNFTWGQTAMQNSTYVGPASFSTMAVDVQLKPQNAQALVQYAQSVSNPHSPLYRKFLTPQQIGNQFGASATDTTAVASYFQKNHLNVGTWPQRLLMVVEGKQADLETAFGTKFGIYRSQTGQQFVAPSSAPHFMQPLAVSALGRIVHENTAHTYFLRPGNAAAFNGMHPSQYARGFDFTGAYGKGYNGSGVSLGIIGTAGISSADLAQMASLTGAHVAPVTVVPVVTQTANAANNNTGTGAFGSDPTGFRTPPPVTGPCTTGAPVEPAPGCNPEDGEAQLDTQQAASLAPGANVLFYLAYNVNDCGGPCSQYGISGIQGLYESDDEIQQAIADNTADVISMSYGGGDPQNVGYYYDASGVGIGPLEFAALATEGIAAFASSGDNGAYECDSFNGTTYVYVTSQCASYPATDPNVVAVGGVNIPLDNAGNLVAGQQITAWGDNTTGGGNGVFIYNSVGSGGGPSSVFPIPSWQIGVAGIGAMRSTPDISMEGDGLTGPLTVTNAAFPSAYSAGAFGGTSVAAPQMAAAWAVVLSACKAIAACSAHGTGAHPYRLGNPNPLLYGIYRGNTTYAAPSAFYDVVAGSNGAVTSPGNAPSAGFSAGPGYDMVTGIGVPFVGYTINAVVQAQGGTNPNVP